MLCLSLPWFRTPSIFDRSIPQRNSLNYFLTISIDDAESVSSLVTLDFALSFSFIQTWISFHWWLLSSTNGVTLSLDSSAVLVIFISSSVGNFGFIVCAFAGSSVNYQAYLFIFFPSKIMLDEDPKFTLFHYCHNIMTQLDPNLAVDNGWIVLDGSSAS